MLNEKWNLMFSGSMFYYLISKFLLNESLSF